MSVSLLVERMHSHPSGPISLDEWKQLIASDPDLRLRTEPYLAVNPRTGDRITIPAGEADTELLSGEEWLPFLWFSRGRLEIAYRDEFDDPTDPIRLKLAKIAIQL